MTAGQARILPLNLIAAAQAGDQDAIASLLAISQPDLRRYALRSCQAADIDDAVQEALWLMHRRIGGLHAATSFASWLFQIVRRECMRLARHGLGNLKPLDAIQDHAAFAVRPMLDLRLDLAAAIQSLHDHYRIVFLMRDVEEMTIEEIGSALDLTREAVKARLHRARRLVREYLKD